MLYEFKTLIKNTSKKVEHCNIMLNFFVIIGIILSIAYPNY